MDIFFKGNYLTINSRRVLLLTQILGVIVAGFLAFNIIHLIVSHLPLLSERYKAKVLVSFKSSFVKRLAFILTFAGVAIIFTVIFLTMMLFELQEQTFFSRVSKDVEAIKAFAEKSEREIESLKMKIYILTRNGLKKEKVKDVLGRWNCA